MRKPDSAVLLAEARAAQDILTDIGIALFVMGALYLVAHLLGLA